MTVTIEAEEWPMVAGLIGLSRVVGKENLTITSRGIVLQAETLNGLAKKYIYQLIETFDVVKRDVQRMEQYLAQAQKNPEKIKDYVSQVHKLMKDQIDKIKKYYADTKEYAELLDVVQQVKGVKKEAELPIVQEAIRSYQRIASTPFIREKLTLNYIKAEILNPFFGQTSILQKSFYTKETEEHIQKIDEDFVQPAYYELQFAQCLKEAKDYTAIMSFLEKYQADYKPFKDFLKAVKKSKSLEQVKTYFEQEVLHCSFIDGLVATQSFEEMMFSPLAFSKANSVNFNWQFEKKQPVPISAVARLILFMAPFGLTFYTRRMGSSQSSVPLRFAGLILSQQSFPNIINENNHYRQLRTEGSTFEEAIIGVLQESMEKAKLINNAYLFLEVHSDYQKKKTLLDYYHMPVYLVKYLAKYGKVLRLLHHRELRDAFLRTVLKGIDPKQVVFAYLREAVTNSHHGEGACHAARERKRILEAKKGVSEMGKYDKLITYIYYQGVKLRQEYVHSRSTMDEGGPYRASGRKKLEGIAYRLINATKAGNKQTFMDTIFRLYLGTSLEVPSFFVDAFKEEGLDFETMASVFIAGMLSQETREHEEVINHE